MNQVPEEKKDSVTKTLAILGFVAIIILIVWLAVKVVAMIPSAFSSLASIADSVYNNGSDSELVVSTQNSVVNTGQSFEVSWTEMRGNGTYGFVYKCTDGVSIDIRRGSAGIETVACDTFVDLEDDTNLNILINAEKQRFTDVEYAIVYTQEGAENIVAQNTVTVVNASIPTGVTASDDESESSEETPEETVAGVSTDSDTNSNPTYTPGEPTVVTNYIYKVPESDPKGTIDLQITHLGVGTVKSGVFVPSPELKEDVVGAIQFEIKNIGTKTAEDWSYEADLPSDMNYKSGDQKALKPNERVVVTLGFDGITRTGTEKFGVEVEAKGDINKANNDYTWSVKVVK